MAGKKKKTPLTLSELLKRYDLWIALVVFLLMIPAERTEIFNYFENQTLSARHLLRNHYAEPADRAFLSEKIAIANLDEPFFAEYGSFPLRRTDVGKIVENLRFLGAKVVVVDMLMDFPSSYQEDPVIAESLKKTENTILVSMLQIRKGHIEKVNYPTKVIKDASLTAYSNHTESAGMQNRLRIFPEAAQKFGEWPVTILALAKFLEVEPRIENHVLHLGDRQIGLDQFNDLHIDFSSLRSTDRLLTQNPYVGIPGMALLEFDPEDADEDEIEELKDLVDGKLVFLGDTSEVSHDLFDTIVGEVYGVEVMAQEANTILMGARLRPASDALEITVLLVFMMLLVSLHFLSEPKFRFPLLFLLFGAYIASSGFVYVQYGIILSMSYLLFAGFIAFAAINIYLFIQERKERSFIQGAFGQYLSPAVIEALVEDPDKLQLGGERREMTAYFSDVAGFSTISESLTPEELVNLLNEYLTEMCQVISDSNGTVDKFEGDAIIAFWGAPLEQLDHAKRACWASIEMQDRLIDMRKRLKEEGRPILNVRMGVNSGPMVVGNMGSKTRMDYTMMGDAVNLAARLEGANKFYKNYSMISHNTYNQAKEFIDVRELDVITVVGKDEPITVYDLIGKKNTTTGTKAQLVEIYNQGLKAYKSRDFVKAGEIFAKALDVIPTDGPSLTYQARCQQLLTNPPEKDWDGVWRLTEKG